MNDRTLGLCIAVMSGCGASDTGDAGFDAGTVTTATDAGALPTFSFFVTSYRALQQLSGRAEGFGGDLRFGQTGALPGLRGADLICATIAAQSMPGAEAKQWRAFLSVVDGGDGLPRHAIERVGTGPWYDRLGRLVAMNPSALAKLRPQGADPLIIDDLPNEDGVPNHRPDPSLAAVDNHHVLTGSDDQGHLFSTTSTCLDWTSALGDRALEGQARAGRSWPQGPVNDKGDSWIAAVEVSGCAAGVNLANTGGIDLATPTVGSGGGYGAIYCFALTP